MGHWCSRGSYDHTVKLTPWIIFACPDVVNAFKHGILVVAGPRCRTCSRTFRPPRPAASNGLIGIRARGGGPCGDILCASQCKPCEDEGDDWQHCLLLEGEANDRLKREDPAAYEAKMRAQLPTSKCCLSGESFKGKNLCCLISGASELALRSNQPGCARVIRAKPKIMRGMEPLNPIAHTPLAVRCGRILCESREDQTSVRLVFFFFAPAEIAPRFFLACCSASSTSKRIAHYGQ